MRWQRLWRHVFDVGAHGFARWPDPRRRIPWRGRVGAQRVQPDGRTLGHGGIDTDALPSPSANVGTACNGCVYNRCTLGSAHRTTRISVTPSGTVGLTLDQLGYTAPENGGPGQT